MRYFALLLALVLLSPAAMADDDDDIKTLDDCHVTLSVEHNMMMWFCMNGTFRIGSKNVMPLGELEIAPRGQKREPEPEQPTNYNKLWHL